MWYPEAERHPVVNFGYPQGTHGQLKANGPKGSFWHDAQGWKAGAEATFNTPGRGGAHIIINLEGPPWQFIDLDDAAWHAGGAIPTGFHELANLFYWGIEFEGGYPKPHFITEHQLAEAVKLHLWLAGHYPIVWKFERRVDLWEHREVYNTSCPNDRILWPEAIARLKGDDMDDENLDALKWHIGILNAYLHERQAMEAFAASYALTPQQFADPEYMAEHDRKYRTMLRAVVDWRK